MSSNRYKCITLANCDGYGSLTLGKVYIITKEMLGGQRAITFTGDDGHERGWAEYYLKQFELVEPAMLCAPTTVQRKLKGVIFDRGDDKLERYFLYQGCGCTSDKNLAYVYGCEQARELARNDPYWCRKCDGKWLLVYE